MRTYSQGLSLTLLSALLILTSCQKDIRESGINAAARSDNALHGNANLRLLSASSEFGKETYQYNDQGLLSVWYNEQINAIYRHEYDANGNLLAANVYSLSDVLQTRIRFFYNAKGQRFHEIWTNVNTGEITDEVFYTFSQAGACTKIESPVQHYFVINEYTPEGNLQNFQFYSNGTILASVVYTFNNHIKNPFSAIPGLLFAYPFANAFFYTNKWYSTSETFTFYDENGQPLEVFPQDPSKTIAEAGPSNYVAKSDFWDEVSSSFFHFVFSYEKGGNQDIKSPKSISKKRQALQQLLIHDNKKLSQKIKEVRTLFTN